MPTPYDGYAEAVALVGPESYLYGESVLAMHDLTSTNPKKVYVATPKRVRKGLPSGISVVQRPVDESTTTYEGIPSQSVYDAIRSCEGSLTGERLRQAAENARRNGLVTRSQHERLMEELA